MSTIIKATDFAFIARFVDVESIYRPCLTGVFVDPAGVIVATDGARMGMLRLPDFGPDSTSDVIIRADKDFLRACTAKPARGNNRYIMFDRHGLSVCEMQSPDAPLSETVSVATFTNPYIDGRFPDWRRVVPNPAGEYENGCSAGFVGHDMPTVNVNYLASFANPDRSSKFIQIKHFGGEWPMLISNGMEGFLGLLMPIRDRSALVHDWRPLYAAAVPPEPEITPEPKTIAA